MSTCSPTVVVPQSLLGKFHHYRLKHGVIVTLLLFAGRKSRCFWRAIGFFATRPYVHRWLREHPDPKTRILNLGGGSNCLPGCLTVDIDARADAYTDITRPLPFPDTSFGSVFCEEVIEHIDLEAGRCLLREIHRILIPGGIVRCTTPDAIYFARILLASPENTRPINEIFYFHEHRHIYSPIELCNEMRAAGFQDPVETKYCDESSRLGHLDTHPARFNHPPEISQYIEAAKPK